MIEMMVVVLILGALTLVALPRFMVYQLRSKTGEVKVNLAAIRVSEESYYSGFERYLSAAPEPTTLPGMESVAFDGQGSDFAKLGYGIEGNVYFSYGVAISPSGTGYTIDAAADIDGDGIAQFWGYTKLDSGGALVPGMVGCNAAALDPLVLSACDPNSGRSVF